MQKKSSMTTLEILQTARDSKRALAMLDGEQKNAALLAMAQSLEEFSPEILAENAEDLKASEGTISDVMMDRLRLTDERIKSMADGVRELTELPDPARVLSERITKDGLKLKKVAVPMGVVAIIYESRPNVTADAAALCFKSGNVCVLRCGKEAQRSAHAIVKAMRAGLIKLGFDGSFINILDEKGREGANTLMTANGYVDLLIPRGGAGLIKACVENATVPCIETGTGICTVYVDASANQDMALSIIDNAKTQRPSVCNAAECCLVHEEIADEFLPKLRKLLVDDRIADGKQPVEFCYDKFDTEFLDYILAVKTVKNVEDAVEHIAAHSTHHSEAIITEDPKAAEYFIRNIDSAAIYVNASTRFTDGGCFGLGCEMGISTQKLHARGPMGLEELMTYKYIIEGNGQIRK